MEFALLCFNMLKSDHSFFYLFLLKNRNIDLIPSLHPICESNNLFCIMGSQVEMKIAWE